ncbi:hypothetical protein ACFQZO_24355 [Bradyrhizobium sp. GCM10027634]|uniref:hypothetical protein n=1 Tax=unclassified Bradyrhizobium TaxID=2631580 RepID=UPI00263BE78D|nr:hypothetical protein [Bradyrhizobium sp. WYCCWR 12677]MDN5003974.1 hypothetical protein [Bradyrhizobium sp. WYCCWR 12677]
MSDIISASEQFADFRRVFEGFVERAMAYGLSEGRARRLAKETCVKEADRIARERRSRFEVIEGAGS